MAYYSNSPDYALQQYGAAMPTMAGRKVRSGGRLNLGAICLSLFLPWILFCFMYAVMSFSLHYKEKLTCYLLVFLGLLVVIVLAKLARDSVKNPESSDSNWACFLAAACFLAWILGVCCGDLNYFYNMQPFYDTSNLNQYPSVDPPKMPGQQVMDAGTMTFTKGSKIDLMKTMAFHNSDAYCVAPIISGDKQAYYDFWAVGMNCCMGTSSEFSCGEAGNPAALSGLRVMREDQREFYRLAVKQAENAYGIKAKHPMFFHWMEDPGLELAAYMDEGFKYFLFGVYAFFALLLFLVIVALVCFAKH